MSEQLQNTRIGFIGCGAMAEALATGLIGAGVSADLLLAADPATAARERIAKRLRIATTESNAEVLAWSSLIVLAVKPGLVPVVLTDLSDQPQLQLSKPLWVSIAAGVTLAQIAERLPEGCRIIRVMPNTPALVAAGASALCPNPKATEADRELAEALFAAVGTTWTVADEALLDAVTGLSGSGPAYVFLIMEALGDAGVKMGLPRDAAYQLASQTVYGASKLAIESGTHPAVLKDQVTSPGGTTIAGLEQLESGGVRAALYRAVSAATARARELRGEP